MSKIIYVLSRNESDPEILKKMLLNISKNLSPDNIIAKEPSIYCQNHLSYSIINPTKTIIKNNSNVLLGALFRNSNWENFDKTNYDGNQAIFRLNNIELQILTDVLSTRTVWYYKNEQLFIASTSQRAIIQYLGDFEFNEAVIPWMISSGSLGPQLLWDSRIKKISPDECFNIKQK